MNKKNVVTAMCHQAVHSPRSINRMLFTTSCPPRALFPSSHSEDAGLSMTLAAAWRLLADDRECLALLEVWLMGSVSLSGSLSARRIAEGHCVCALASSALLLYRNALIDIPEVLINKRTHSFLTLTEFALLVSFLFFWPLMEFDKDFVGCVWRHGNVVTVVPSFLSC